MRAYFTPLRVLTVAGIGLLLVLWCVSLVGLMANTKLGWLYRNGCCLMRGAHTHR